MKQGDELASLLVAERERTRTAEPQRVQVSGFRVGGKRSLVGSVSHALMQYV